MIARGQFDADTGIGNRRGYENLGLAQGPVEHVADLADAARTAGVDRAGTAAIDHGEQHIGAGIGLLIDHPPRQRGIMLIGAVFDSIMV